MKKEIRSITSEINVDGEQYIVGYAAVFNQPSQDLGGFTETVMPGAFTNSLSHDVLCFYNHDDQQLLGRTESGTLELTQDDVGLKFKLLIPDTQLGRDIREMIKRKDLSGMSFGFCVIDENWSSDNTTRELNEVDLFEISVVINPAYLQTSVDLRSLPEQKQNKNNLYQNILLAYI